jgi:thioredoxin reductase/NAD-dependent dihydropyrimidine dehydrogenase PreA subunit
VTLEAQVLALIGLVALAGVFWMLVARRRREQRDSAVLAEAREMQQHIPQTLHPIIDTDTCMGSLSCLAACPEGSILGIVDGRAELISPTSCIGHGRCAAECPVGAIKLVFGTSERGVDLPEVSTSFETARPGVHIVGELGGMGLIKNAITQGLELADHFGGTLARSEGTDVVIVGAGPAGLATALGLKKHGVSFRVLEQDSVGGTVAHYPRRKIVMTERVQLPFLGKFGRSTISKEELLEGWQKAIRKASLKIEERTKVERIEGSDGAFVLSTSNGPVEAKKVVLAIGRRGSPRKLGVPGEEASNKVLYRLTDPEQFEGARVMIVGGGDAALEAAIQLAEETDAEVTLSYRQAELGKARDANKRKFQELAQSGRITAMMPSQVKSVSARAVHIESNAITFEVPNDFVIACLGGELPAAFLKDNGIPLKRLHGESLSGAHGGALREKKEQAAQGRFAWLLFALGALVVLGLGIVGWDYYLLPLADRLNHPGHAKLKPAGLWGHGVGIAATVVMLSNFIYALRKRWGVLKGVSSIRRWLTFHQFVGFMSPLVIAFHAAFQSRNGLATATTVALMIVVATGVLGRFIYQMVPGAQRPVEFDQIKREWTSLQAQAKRDVADLAHGDGLDHLLEMASSPTGEHSLAAFLVKLPVQRLSDELKLRRTRSLFPSKEQFRQFYDIFARLRVLQAQTGFYRGLKRLLSIWRAFHVVLAVVLLVVIVAHIGLALHLGYRWIWSSTIEP